MINNAPQRSQANHSDAAGRNGRCLRSTARTGGPADQGFVIHAATHLVEVNTVVQDKKGSTIAGLQREDFEIFEHGKRQQIALFVPEQARLARPAPLPPHMFTNRLPAQTGARTGYTVILLDWLNGFWGDRTIARRHVIRLLTQIQPHDLLTLCVLDQDLRILHDFTSDTAELLRKLAAETNRAGGPLAERKKPDLLTDASAGVLDLIRGAAADSPMQTFLATRRILDTISAFEQIAQYLRGVPGRKSLIWVSSGFPSMIGFLSEGPGPGMPRSRIRAGGEMRTFGPELDRVFRALNSADVSVYPVDARGLLLGGGRANIATMLEFAARTGGRAYYNRNDLDIAIRSALDDSAVSYTLGYYPSIEKPDGKFLEIRVKVRRPGFTVRQRRGYHADVAPIQDDAHAEAELDRALASPLDSTTLPLSARAGIDGESAIVQMELDAMSLSLHQQDGRWQGKVQLQAAFRPDKSQTWTRVLDETLHLNMLDETYEKTKRETIPIRQELKIPKDAAWLRLVARDAGSGATGSLTVAVEAIRGK